MLYTAQQVACHVCTAASRPLPSRLLPSCPRPQCLLCVSSMQVHVSPMLSDMKTVVDGSCLLVYGTAQPRTNHRVELSSRMTDVYDQCLRRGSQVSVSVPMLEQHFSVLAPGASTSTGYPGPRHTTSTSLVWCV